MHRKLARKNTEYTKILHIARRRGGDSEDDNKFRVSKCSLFKYVCSFTIRSTGTGLVVLREDNAANSRLSWQKKSLIPEMELSTY